jgi:hypothetical protein
MHAPIRGHKPPLENHGLSALIHWTMAFATEKKNITLVSANSRGQIRDPRRILVERLQGTNHRHSGEAEEDCSRH